MTSPSARASVEAYLAAKRAGLYPAARKGGYTPDIGAEQEFKVSEGATNSAFMLTQLPFGGHDEPVQSLG